LQVGPLGVLADLLLEIVCPRRLPEGPLLGLGVAKPLATIPLQVAEGQHGQVEPAHHPVERTQLVLAQPQLALALPEELLYLPSQSVPMEQLLHAGPHVVTDQQLLHTDSAWCVRVELRREQQGHFTYVVDLCYPVMDPVGA